MKSSHPKKRGRPIAGKVSQKVMAAAAGVTVKTLLEWRKEGVNITDETAVMARAATARRKEPSVTHADGSESHGEAKRRRAVADADRAEVIARRESGSVIPVADVEALFAQLGAELRSCLLAMRGNLVVELEGQTGPAIYKILDNRICELLTTIQNNSPKA